MIDDTIISLKPTAKIVWLGGKPTVQYFTKTKKSQQFEMATLSFYDKKETFTLQISKAQADWLLHILPQLSPNNAEILTFQEVKADYEAAGLEDFELFWYNKPFNAMGDFGLLSL